MVELDELKTKWQQYDRQLEESLQLNRALLSSAKLKPAQSQLRRLAVYTGLEALVWLIIVIALGDFIAGRVSIPRLAFSAAAVDAMSIGMMIALIRRTIGVLRIDYGQPIAALQERVEALRIMRIRTTRLALLFGTLLWVPWLAVALEAVFGFDLYRSVDPVWLIANGLFGLALFPAALWAARRYWNRPDRSPFFQRVVNDLAGNNLNAAHGFLARLGDFEKE